jgi:hypothetical protein
MRTVITLAVIGFGCVALAVCLAGLTPGDHSSKAIQNGKGRLRMTSQSEQIAFGLTVQDVSKVQILYGFYSAKTGAGKQEILISGDGTVRLYLTKSMYDTRPESRQGKVSTDVILRLLNVIEGENFFGLEDHYPPTHDPHARRVLRMTLPNREKTVMVDEPRCPEFERVAGAVKLAAGIALPEALNQRFFPNL